MLRLALILLAVPLLAMGWLTYISSGEASPPSESLWLALWLIVTATLALAALGVSITIRDRHRAKVLARRTAPEAVEAQSASIPADIAITYRRESGEEAELSITVWSIKPVAQEELPELVTGFSFLHREVLSFQIVRVLHLLDLETGEALDDDAMIRSWFIYKRSQLQAKIRTGRRVPIAVPEMTAKKERRWQHSER